MAKAYKRTLKDSNGNIIYPQTHVNAVQFSDAGGTLLGEYLDATNIIINNKMDKTNPAGTGSLSLNRKADTIIGDYSVAEGQENIASGKYSHAEGNDTTASAASSHAEGWQTTASGQRAHAEGYGTQASGFNSHAEGYNTKAQNNQAHAEGNGTIASGLYSHAEGDCTIAAGRNQHVQGKCNVQNENFLDIVGNGTSTDARSNAYALDVSGNAWFAGDIYVKSNSTSTSGTKITPISYGTTDVTSVSNLPLGTIYFMYKN